MSKYVEEDDRDKRKHRKKMTAIDEGGVDDDDDCERPWSQLPDLALHSISMRLGLMEYLAFGGVCKPWRLVSGKPTREFMESQPPMLTFTAHKGSGQVFNALFSISEKRFYTEKIPRGFSNSRLCYSHGHGYLIMENHLKCQQFLLANPFTGDVIDLPKPSFAISNPILSSSPTSSDCMLLSFDPLHNNVGCCYLRNPKWEECRYSEDSHIIRATVFDNRVFALTQHGRLATFDFRPSPKMKLLEVEPAPITEMPYARFSPCLLAGADEELWLLDLVVYEGYEKGDETPINMERFAVYMMDFWTGRWEKQESLKGKALFVGDQWCFLASNPTAWGGRENCIYVTGYLLGFCSLYSVYSFDGALVETIKPSRSYSIVGQQNWIFPNLQTYVVDVEQ